MMDATATTDRHYKVTFKTYAAQLALVRFLLSYFLFALFRSSCV